MDLLINQDFLRDGKNRGVYLLKFLATFLITWSHMDVCYPYWSWLATGGAFGDALFFFCSGFTLFLGRKQGFPDYYKRRIGRIYPAIIVWALLSSFMFGWSWSVTDIFFSSQYWFLQCIMVYYVIFYIIRAYLMNHLKIVFAVCAVIVSVSCIWLTPLERPVMYGNSTYIRVFYFLFMLLGAMVALRKGDKKPRLGATLAAVVGCIAAYYGSMAAFKHSVLLCHFQVLSLIPLLGVVYYLYLFSQTDEVSRFFERPVLGKVVYAVSALTLEVYVVQYHIFRSDYNDIFPLNLLLYIVFILLAAYTLKVLSNLFSQVFSDKPFDAPALFRL